ncbi:MAG: hypothetical protein ACI8PZ_005589, partial [Myxococcota bacterium]
MFRAGRAPMLALAACLAFPASAACPPDEPLLERLTCSDSIRGELDPGARFGVTLDPADIESTLGAVGDEYACGLPYAPLVQRGPEDVYAFECQNYGLVRLRVTGLECDLDIYILDDTCSPDFGCVQGSTDAFAVNDEVDFYCIEGDVYYIVIEGFGFTPGAEDSCNGFRPPVYQLEFDLSAGAGCAEDCDDGLDNDFDRAFDCDDADCLGDPACGEICDDGRDNDLDGGIDCRDGDCFDEPYCCDDDNDGFVDVECGGTDCDDGAFHSVDADGDLWPNACDNCTFVYNEDQDDADLDGVGDACERCPGWPDELDADGDGVPDGCDVCPGADDRHDLDGDGTPDACDDC